MPSPMASALISRSPSQIIAMAKTVEDDGILRLPGDEPIRLAVGDVLDDRYELRALMGSGAAGAVYQARDRATDAHVAVKVLTTSSRSRQVVERLRREVRAAWKVTHPGVVRIYDLIETEGQLALSMELVDGETLQARLRRGGRLSSAEWVALAQDLARSLAAAHAAGVVHRDLKPSNIILRAGTGRAVVTDFGVSRLADIAEPAILDKRTLRDLTLTAEGAVIGTPMYMAPEQLLGRQNVGPAADVYSYGVVLFEGAVGILPHDAGTLADLLEAKLTRPAPSLRSLRSDLPAEMTAIVDQCLAGNVAQRPQSGAELRRELALLAKDEPVSRRWLVAALLGVFALAAAIAALAWSRHSKSPMSSWKPILKTWSNTQEALHEPSVSPDGRWVAVDSTRAGHLDIWLLEVATGRWTPLTSDPEEDMYPSFVNQGRSVVFFSARQSRPGLWRIDLDGDRKPRFVMAMRPYPTVPTADGNRVVYRIKPRILAVLDLRDGLSREIAKIPNGMRFRAFKVGPDNQVIASVQTHDTGDDATITASDLCRVGIDDLTGECRWVTRDQLFNEYATFVPGEAGSLIVSSGSGGAQNLWKFYSDGKLPVQMTFGSEDHIGPTMVDRERLFFTSDASYWQLYSSRSPDHPWRKLTHELQDHRIPSLARDGKTLVFTQSDRYRGTSLWTASAPSFDATKPLEHSAGYSRGSWSPGGSQMVAITEHEGTYGLALLRSETGERRELLSGQRAPFCGSPALSLAQRHVVFTRTRGEEPGLYIAKIGSGFERVASDATCNAKFSPANDDELAYMRWTLGDAVRVLEVMDLRTHAVRTIATLPGLPAISWHPDGKSIYVVNEELRRIQRIDATSGAVTEEREFPEDTAQINELTAGPDGLLIVEALHSTSRLLSIENIDALK